MSKSKGNIVDPFYMVETYGKNAYRYFMLREVTPGADGTFQEELFIKRFNSDLANDLGNLLNRTLTMAQKYFDGIVPDRGKLDDKDKAILQMLKELPAKLDKHITDMRLNQALVSVWEVINAANKHIELSKPWELVKSDNIDRLKAVIYTLLQVLASCVFLLYPFMPDAALQIARQLGMNIEEKDITFDDLDEPLKPGTKTDKKDPIFPRI